MAKKVLGLKGQQFLGSIIIIGLIALYLILGFSGFDLMDAMIKINQWFYARLGELGIYIATFIISIFGNFTIILPVPYILSILTVLLTLPINPIILALFAALGASIGELSAWLLGRGAAELMSEEFYDKKIKGLELLIEKGYGFWLVLLFAATPLPDDILLIALGMQKYSLKKSLTASIIGKFLQVISLFFIVFLAKNTLLGQLVLYAFGLDVTNGGVQSTGNTTLSTITMAITITFTIILITVDWEKLWKRLKKKKALK